MKTGARSSIRDSTILSLVLSLIFGISACQPALPEPASAAAPAVLSLPGTATPEPASRPTADIKASTTITGTVIDLSLSARILWLETPVDGLELVALSDDCTISNPIGGGIELRQIFPGMSIQASGRKGNLGALIADHLTALGMTSTPSSTSSSY